MVTLRKINSGMMLMPKPLAAMAMTEISSLSVYLILGREEAFLSTAWISLSEPFIGIMKGSLMMSSRDRVSFSVNGCPCSRSTISGSCLSGRK
ncbi:hypothetical protein D3C87_1752580 [compost metagenome]